MIGSHYLPLSLLSLSLIQLDAFTSQNQIRPSLFAKRAEHSSSNRIFSSLKESTAETDLQLEEDVFMTLTRHESHDNVNSILAQTESLIREMYEQSLEENDNDESFESDGNEAKGTEEVFANSYVDLGKVRQ